MIGTYTAQNIGMSDDIQNSGFSGANTEETRESHADSVEFTQENEVQAIEAGAAAIITEASGCISGYADFWVQSLERSLPSCKGGILRCRGGWSR